MGVNTRSRFRVYIGWIELMTEALEDAPERAGRVPYLETSIVLHYCVCKINPLSAPHKLAQLRPPVHPNVIPDKVPVDAVSSPLLLVQDNIGRW